MSTLKVRDSASNAIKRYLQISISDEPSDIDAIETYLQLLEEQWLRFATAQQDVEVSCGHDNVDFEEQSRIQAEVWYTSAKSNFKRCLKRHAQATPPNQVVTPATSQLPKLQLPSFNGDATEWHSFNDAFQALVHLNKSLSDGQKLHYLRTCLKGEALELVSSLAICDGNYDVAWQLLLSRYKVMRVMVDCHLKAIFSVEKATKDSGKAIKQVLNIILQHVGALRTLGRPVEFWDDILVHLTVSKLAFETRKQWELSLTDDNLSTFDELREFLEIRARSLEMIPTSSAPATASHVPRLNKNMKNSASALHALGEHQKSSKSSPSQTKQPACPHCTLSHKIYVCPSFVQLDPPARFAAIKAMGACINCLSEGHFQSKCRSQASCRICNQRHHTLLHNNSKLVLSNEQPNPLDPPLIPNRNRSTTQTPPTTKFVSDHRATIQYGTTHTTQPMPNASEISIDPANQLTSHFADADRAILLATAIIYIQDYSGCLQPARALLDNGSHASFVTEACVQRLRVPRSASSAVITGIGSLKGGKTRGEVKLTLSPQLSDQYFHINALILSKITNDLPTSKVQVSSWPHLQGLTLADPQCTNPGPIDLLIGMDEMDKFLLPGLCKGPPETPMAQNTTFGWVLFGNATKSPDSQMAVTSLHCDVQLVRMVSKFWELEDSPPRRHFTPEEARCEQFFAETTRRHDDGRYVVRLPLKDSVPLGESRNSAVRSLLRMEKRFAVDQELSQQYKKFMHELLDMGHMELASDDKAKMYYMPHHAVLKETSATTKLRVVFNASMKTSTGHSLNDALMVGPQLQQDLFSTLVRFRTHRYGIMADVEKMYRQVCVAEEDIDFQRIVWRNDPSEIIRDYRILRVTYGVAAASHLAVKTLQQTALDAGPDHKQTAEVVIRDFYMDDLLTGTHSADSLETLQTSISKVLSSGGFELRKWATNCKVLREKIPYASKSISHLLAEGDEVRTLGLIWNTSDDSLSIAVNLNQLPTKLTKRVLLSDSSKVFDPLGLLAPCTIRSKIWLQTLWRSDVDWDELIPSDVEREWIAHRQELSTLASLKLNRWIGTGPLSLEEFHLFVDASERAYAAALYCRTSQPGGHTKVVLIAARAKVAPLRSTTLPRLELCAAHLGAKLVKQVQSSFGRQFNKIFAWTDSTVTLAWLQGHPGRWSVFVANRVADVQEVLPPACWQHVRSECNPADCASRGVTPLQLINHQLWWEGPHWLRSDEYSWGNQTTQHSTNLEQRSSKTSAHISRAVDDWDLLTKYNSFFKLKRVTAYVIRFLKNARPKVSERAVGQLSCEEVCDAEIRLVRYNQFNSFESEISNCRLNKAIPLKSKLLRLRPYLDPKGVLRVGGRINQAAALNDVKHPIILSNDSPLARMIVLDIHLATLHSGPQIMQTVLQRRFWVLGMRDVVRSVYRNCVRCKRLNRQPLQQVMAELPRSRVESTRCFLHSAVDFAGPYLLKFSHGRGAKSTKSYICSFICMSTGAMHLELVGDLSSTAFIAAFKRFTSRRGHCQHLYSDNGTNFVGAEREMRATYQRCMSDEAVSLYFIDAGTTWHFNPPGAPHMGGYWEVGIKRIKYHLKRALGSALLTYEEFATLLTEVEACVNSRPICSNSSNGDDLEVLTPGHFIIGEPLKALPEPNTRNFSGTLSQRWSSIVAMRQHFWTRWRNEYLVNLQLRTKWFRSTPDLKRDDVVVIHDPNAPPTKWRLGRVLECHAGMDGHVRVANVKTSEGQLLRPITKLTLLPTKNDIFSL